ncbi:hypothetical protein [Lapidilactobacillus wuchangensis]|uniref:hypothetical protein n=1 Tax=Lapidilactobacillus wuchangensis TaxID=2486001 RepID=UPI000F78CA5D|nr:hypothetical protein [Lapidilactobacillus wuchangensis]
MGEYVKSKKSMKFKDIESLNRVQSVIDDADKAIKQKSRKLKDSPLGETVSGALGAGVGAGIGFAGLYLGGSVAGLSAAGITSGLATAGAVIGGGMAAGVAVLAAPAVVLAGAGIGVASHHKNKKLRAAKELVYKNAIAKQTKILQELKKESDADKERLDYLNGLNMLLKAAINDLKFDLGVSDSLPAES